jgi:hypothetical protein
VTKVVVKRKRYAEGGKVEEKEKPGFLTGLFTKTKPKESTAKYPVGVGSGLSETIRRRQDRMDAVERGEPDPGQNPKQLARGGKVRKKK